MDLNSKTYWDQRFDTNWETNLGRQQSAFFSKIALSAFPEWLVKEIEEKKLSILDWGCALGDGTNEMAQRFPESKMFGIDFSDIAVKDAGQTYPAINFEAINLLTTNEHDSYDVVFSSNTFEHFAQPWQTAKTISQFARQHIIILVPYKEKERYAEHLYTFNETNIPSTLSPSFSLTHLQVIDGSSFTPNYWGELQVLMVYTNNSVAERIEQKKISDTDIRVIELLRLQTEVQKEVAGFNDKLQLQAKLLDEKEATVQNLEKSLQELHQQNARLEYEKQSADNRVIETEQIIHSLEKAISDLIVKVEGKELVEVVLIEKKKELFEKEQRLHENEQALAAAGQKLLEKESVLNEKNQNILELQATVKSLENETARLGNDLDWYKQTFEERSFWGVLKDKALKPSAKNNTGEK